MGTKAGSFRSSMRHALVMTLGVALAGCVGAKEERMGRTYLDTGDYDQAVVAAREAHAKTLRVNDVPRGGGVRIRGESGRAYRLTVVYIDYYRETVGFAIDSLDPSQGAAP